MRVEAWDQGFVPAPPASVYGALAEPAAYPRWWPGLDARVRGDEVLLRLARVPRLVARRMALRPGRGLEVELRGGWPGVLEWYLEPFEEGTIVNAFLRLDVPGAPFLAARRLRRLRVAVHRALGGLREAA